MVRWTWSAVVSGPEEVISTQHHCEGSSAVQPHVEGGVWIWSVLGWGSQVTQVVPVLRKCGVLQKAKCEVRDLGSSPAVELEQLTRFSGLRALPGSELMHWIISNLFSSLTSTGSLMSKVNVLGRSPGLG